MSSEILLINKTTKEKLNKSQKAFNTNIRKVQTYTQRLEKGKEFLKAIEIKILKKLKEPREQILEVLLKKLRLFEGYFDDGFFNKAEKEKIAHYIYSETMGIGHPDIEAIHEKFKILSNSDNDTSRADFVKEMLENQTGFNFDDDDIDFDDAESVEEAIHRKFEEQKATQKKTKRDLKMDEEELTISKVLKTIYKELVMAFHPDKEQNEAQKLKKTEITKQVTIAYKNKDVFKLLSLKIELMASSIDLQKTAETELKYYNKLLSQQIFELERQLFNLDQAANGLLPRMVHNFLFLMDHAPELIDKEITKEGQLLKRHISKVSNESIVLSDKKEARRFLKEYEIERMFLF